jgi:hypothetical protein
MPAGERGREGDRTASGLRVAGRSQDYSAGCPVLRRKTDKRVEAEAGKTTQDQETDMRLDCDAFLTDEAKVEWFVRSTKIGERYIVLRISDGERQLTLFPSEIMADKIAYALGQALQEVGIDPDECVDLDAPATIHAGVRRDAADHSGVDLDQAADCPVCHKDGFECQCEICPTDIDIGG